MLSNDFSPLPESVAVAISDTAPRLASASPDDVPDLLGPVAEAWLEAVEDGEEVDIEAVWAAFPPLTDDIANAAEAELAATHSEAMRAIPILLTFADANPTRVLSGIRVLSFEAGRGGDDFETWRAECTTALIWALDLPAGPFHDRFDHIMDALEDAFFAGRAAGGIDRDPPAKAPALYYAKRVTAARKGVTQRLPSATCLDALADEIELKFAIRPGDVWLAVEEVSRAAAVAGDIHAARLRSEQILGVRRGFVDHADKLKAHGRLTVGAMVMADASRRVLAGVAA